MGERGRWESGWCEIGILCDVAWLGGGIDAWKGHENHYCIIEVCTSNLFEVSFSK